MLEVDIPCVFLLWLGDRRCSSQSHQIRGRVGPDLSHLNNITTIQITAHLALHLLFQQKRGNR